MQLKTINYAFYYVNLYLTNITDNLLFSFCMRIKCITFNFLLIVVLLQLWLASINITEVLFQYFEFHSLSLMFTHFIVLKSNNDKDLFRELPFNISYQEDNSYVEDNNSSSLENNKDDGDEGHNRRVFSELPGSDVFSGDNDDNRKAFSELPGSDVFSDDYRNRRDFSELPGSYVFSDDNDNHNSREYNNYIDNYSNIENNNSVEDNISFSQNDVEGKVSIHKRYLLMTDHLTGILFILIG